MTHVSAFRFPKTISLAGRTFGKMLTHSLEREFANDALLQIGTLKEPLWLVADSFSVSQAPVVFPMAATLVRQTIIR